MKNILLITKREYLTQVKKKSFTVMTVLAPLLMVGFGVLISFMFKANETSSVIQVVDKSGLFKNEMKSTKTVAYNFIPNADESKVKKELTQEDKEIDGILIIPELQQKEYDLLEKNTLLLVNKKIGFDTKKEVANDLKQVIQKQKVKDLGVNEAQIKALDKSFDLKVENISSGDQGDSNMAFAVKSGLAMILTYATFMFIIIYGVRVMRSVLEEKNNRVVEIIISSVKPFDLMVGKILGVTLVALTQFIIWILMTVVAAVFFNTGFSAVQGQMDQNPEVAEAFNFQQYASEISHVLLSLNIPVVIGVFILFFLLGYMFYSSIYAAVGSAVDNETETQQFTLFAIIPLTIGMYGSMTIMNNPDGPMAFWLSMIPFTSPVAMVARIPFGVPVWEIVVSLLLLLGTTILTIYLAGKIYRIGILLYGNKASLKEMWKWMKGS